MASAVALHCSLARPFAEVSISRHEIRHAYDLTSHNSIAWYLSMWQSERRQGFKKDDNDITQDMKRRVDAFYSVTRTRPVEYAKKEHNDITLDKKGQVDAFVSRSQ